jgi:hypothetical protein
LRSEERATSENKEKKRHKTYLGMREGDREKKSKKKMKKTQFGKE